MSKTMLVGGLLLFVTLGKDVNAAVYPYQLVETGEVVQLDDKPRPDSPIWTASLVSDAKVPLNDQFRKFALWEDEFLVFDTQSGRILQIYGEGEIKLNGRSIPVLKAEFYLSGAPKLVQLEDDESFSVGQNQVKVEKAISIWDGTDADRKAVSFYESGSLASGILTGDKELLIADGTYGKVKFDGGGNADRIRFDEQGRVSAGTALSPVHVQYRGKKFDLVNTGVSFDGNTVLGPPERLDHLNYKIDDKSYPISYGSSRFSCLNLGFRGCESATSRTVYAQGSDFQYVVLKNDGSLEELVTANPGDLILLMDSVTGVYPTYELLRN